MLNTKAQLTVDVIAKVAKRKITIANATKLLNRSKRTVERYLQCYRSQGLQFVAHGNTCSEPANKTRWIVSLKHQELPDLHHRNRTDRAMRKS